jgi:sigma-B regulation protein RsbU (phosphoserine phosphatase)
VEATVADDGAEHFDLPLAVEDDTHYHQQAQPLGPGDRIVLYTDGVIEAPGQGHDQFGLDRLKAVLERFADEPLDVLKSKAIEAVHAYTSGPLVHDDVTLLALEVR